MGLRSIGRWLVGVLRHMDPPPFFTCGSMSATLGPECRNPCKNGRVEGDIRLISTLTVEQSICTISISFISVDWAQFAIQSRAEPMGILYCSVLLPDVLYHPVVFVTGILNDISVYYSKLSPIRYTVRPRRPVASPIAIN